MKFRDRDTELQHKILGLSDKFATEQSRYEAQLREIQEHRKDKGQLEDLKSTILALKEKLEL